MTTHVSNGPGRDQMPWSEPLCELLVHALELIDDRRPSAHRAAFILLDNFVELTVHTFLAHDARVPTELRSRVQAQARPTFPFLVTALTESGVSSVDATLLNWHHDVRNRLYHRGAALSIELSTVESFSSIAVRVAEDLLLMKIDRGRPRTEIGMFVDQWLPVEAALIEMADAVMGLGSNITTFRRAIGLLREQELLTSHERAELLFFRKMFDVAIRAAPGWDLELTSLRRERLAALHRQYCGPLSSKAD